MNPPARTTAFVGLLDEGTPVWRPVPAEALGGGRYRLLPTENYDPEDETWEFLPGATVDCEPQRLSDGTCLVAKRAAPE